MNRDRLFIYLLARRQRVLRLRPFNVFFLLQEKIRTLSTDEPTTTGEEIALALKFIAAPTTLFLPGNGKAIIQYEG